MRASLVHDLLPFKWRLSRTVHPGSNLELPLPLLRVLRLKSFQLGMMVVLAPLTIPSPHTLTSTTHTPIKPPPPSCSSTVCGVTSLPLKQPPRLQSSAASHPPSCFPALLHSGHPGTLDAPAFWGWAMEAGGEELLTGRCGPAHLYFRRAGDGGDCLLCFSET